MAAIAQTEVPLVIDADAINIFAETPKLLKTLRAPAVFTPHVGEYLRLAAALGIAADPKNQSTRRTAASLMAKAVRSVVVLKGYKTVVSDGIVETTIKSGSVALATAGTGDALAGVIAGLIAQYHPKPFSLLKCASLGAEIHGLAADLWVEQNSRRGMLVTDLLEYIPKVV